MLGYLPTLVPVPAGTFIMGSFAFKDSPPQEVQVPEFLIGKTAVSNYQFRMYRDHMAAQPYALFGINKRTGATDLIVRCEEEQVKEGQRPFTDLYEDLEVRSVFQKPGEWEIEKDEGLRERFGGDDQPAVFVNWWEATSYCDWAIEMMKIEGLLSPENTGRGRLPSESEWEKAARGPEVDVVKQMQEEGILPTRFESWVKGRYENFRRKRNGRILTVKELRLRGKEAILLSGWRVYSTPSGRLTEPSEGEVWWKQDWRTGKTQDVDWGPVTGFGSQQMSGGVWELCGAKYKEVRRARGGSWNDLDPIHLHAAFRNYGILFPDTRDLVGFRVAVASQLPSH